MLDERVYSANGAGKIVYPHAEEWKQIYISLIALKSIQNR